MKPKTLPATFSRVSFKSRFGCVTPNRTPIQQRSANRFASVGFRSLPWRRAPFLTLLGAAVIALSCGANPLNLNAIQEENRRPGTISWELTNPANNRQIEGYASLTSVVAGGDIDLFVNTQDATYSLSIFRMGWYGGTGGRKVGGEQKLPGVRQVTPTADPTTGLIECHWTNPVTIHVPSSWLSGIYLVKLHGNTSHKESYIIFTVRDSRQVDIVFQQSVNTYQAYNPSAGMGSCGRLRGWIAVHLPDDEWTTNDAGLVQSPLRPGTAGEHAFRGGRWGFSHPRLRRLWS